MSKTREKAKDYRYRDRARLDEAAKRYAAADPSDPFALARARTHLRNGLAGVSMGPDGKVLYAPYDAEPSRELRRIERADGSALEWDAITYRNRVRP